MRPAGRLRALVSSRHWLSSRAAKHMAKVIPAMRAIPVEVNVPEQDLRVLQYIGLPNVANWQLQSKPGISVSGDLRTHL